MDRVEGFKRIYQAAAESEDGLRCMVAPHPKLQIEMQQALAEIRAAAKSNMLIANLVATPEPRHPGMNNGMIVPPADFPLGTPPSSIRNRALLAGPLQGVVRVIVVLVDFPDKSFDAAHDVAHFRKLFFELDGALQSVRDYYRDVTNQKVDIQGEVVGPYTMPLTIKQYAHNKAGTGNAFPNARTMARDAAKIANPHVDFTPYDNHQTGFVDAFVVVHAGKGGEVTGDPDDIWSHKWVVQDGPLSVDNAKIYAYLTVPEDARVGVCCHELGHLLFGFPDLYDADYSSQGVGDWCLMGGGSWGGGGDRPVHPSAWCKLKQNWVSVQKPSANTSISLPDVKASHEVWMLTKGGVPSPEYFLLEHRRKTATDLELPGEGLLIWHVDENIEENTNEFHYKVALMQADNKRDLEKPASPTNQGGDAGDPYPGTTNNKNFNHGSAPSSDHYGSVQSGVAVEDIKFDAGKITAKIRVAARPVPTASDDGVVVQGDGSPLLGLAARVAALEADMRAIKGVPI